jgi:hypothetical protein
MTVEGTKIISTGEALMALAQMTQYGELLERLRPDGVAVQPCSSTMQLITDWGFAPAWEEAFMENFDDAGVVDGFLQRIRPAEYIDSDAVEFDDRDPVSDAIDNFQF